MFVHQVMFTVIIGSLNLYNIIDGAPWWALWPSLIWGFVLTVHVCIVRSITVDESWVDQRAADLREHSYDFGHMHDLQHRIIESDFSVVPREEREYRDKGGNADKGTPADKVDKQDTSGKR